MGFSTPSKDSDRSRYPGGRVDHQPGPGMHISRANRFCVRCLVNRDPKGGVMRSRMFFCESCK